MSISSSAGNEIFDLTGINYFPNLINLFCAYNLIVSLDVSSLINLQYLGCYNNNLNYLNISGLNDLIQLDCSNNNLVSLDISNLSGLRTVHCVNNHLSFLNVEGANSLKDLLCDTNNFITLDLQNLPQLTYIDCHSNPHLEALLLKGNGFVANGFYTPSNNIYIYI